MYVIFWQCVAHAVNRHYIKIRYTKKQHFIPILIMNKIRYAILMERFLIHVCAVIIIIQLCVVRKESKRSELETRKKKPTQNPITQTITEIIIKHLWVMYT